jgi:pimeloyl-ACP methyl ester carboxylesterase
MSAVLFDQVIVHYEAMGRGRPIVFLHGWVGSWRYWMDSMQVASTSFRAYGLDLFGYGDTTHDPLRYTLERQSSLLKGFLEEMGIGKIAIVGHGLGALVGFYYATEQPGNVDRVMAVNCPLYFNSLNARLKSATPTELVDWLSSRTPEVAMALSDAAKSDPRAVAFSINSFQTHNLFAQFTASNVPCLLVYGQNDPSMIVPLMEETASMSHHIHQINLEESGYFPMLDEPAEFNRLLTDFLAIDSGLSPRELQLKEEWKRRVR